MSATFSVINPYTQQEYYQYELTSLNEAIKKLSELSLSNYSVLEFTQKIDLLIFLIKKNKSEISEIISKEIGKTTIDTDIEIDRAEVTINAIEMQVRFQVNYSKVKTIYLEKINGLAKHAPLGIVLAITPFNFPLNLALHKIVPALAMGNSVLFKPHPQCYKAARAWLSFYEGF